MIIYSEELIRKAKENAIEMMQSGERLRKVQFGRKSGSFYLSNDATMVIGGTELDVDGNMFFISLFKVN